MKLRLGKLLFPRLPPDLQARRVNTILVVLTFSILLGGLVALMMVLRNKLGTR